MSNARTHSASGMVRLFSCDKRGRDTHFGKRSPVVNNSEKLVTDELELSLSEQRALILDFDIDEKQYVVLG